MRTRFKQAALALAAPAMLAAGAPALAATAAHQGVAVTHAAPIAESWQHGRDRYDDRRYGQRAYYAEPVYANTPVWRGRDGRYYCRKKNGTTGLIIGGAAGALIGREIAGRGDRTLGTIIGAAGGALLGREVDRGGSGRRCR